METITAEEFKNRYGEDATGAFVKPSTPKPQGYISRVTEKVEEDITKRADRTGEILRRPNNLLTKGFQLFGQGAGAAANALETTVAEAPVAKQALGALSSGMNWLVNSDYSVVKALGDKIGGSKPLQELVTLYDNDPDVKDSIDAVANTVRLGLDVKGAVDTAAGVITKVKNIGQPKLTIGGRDWTLKEMHSAQGTKAFDRLPPHQQAAWSAFDKKYSLLEQIKNLKNNPQARPSDVTEMTKLYEAEFGKLPANLGGVEDAAAGAARATQTAPGGLDVVEQVTSKAKSWMQKPIPPSVETVLKETPTPLYDEYVTIGKQSRINNKNPTAMDHVGKKAQTALDIVDRKLSTIGENKSAVMNSSVGRQSAGNIVVKFRQELEQAIRSKAPVQGDLRVYQEVLDRAKSLGNNPTRQQVDQFIDYVQDRIYTGKRDLTLPMTDAVEATLRPITGRLNTALKLQMPESYRVLNQQYADMVGTRNELNLKLGPEGEKGGALMKRVFSPSDANTKKLFADVYKITGIDLVNEATLARYIMDILGDSRQKSMLEQLNLSTTKPSAGGVVNRLIDYLVEKANSPEELLERARALTNDGGANP